MANITNVNNGDTGLEARNAINQNFANLNGDKLENTLFTGALTSLADDAGTWDVSNEVIGKAEINLTSNSIISLSNTVNKGLYYLKITKTTASNITLQINQTSLTTIYPDSQTELNLIGSINTVYEVVVSRYSTAIIVYSNSFIEAVAVIIDETNFKVGQGENLQTILEDIDLALLNARSTGMRFGGIGTVNGGIGVGTTMDVTSGAGQILDNTDAENPTFIEISFTAKTNVALDVTSPSITYWYYDDNTDVLKQTTDEPTVEQRKTRLYLFRTSFSGGAITGVASEVTTTQQEGGHIRELSEAIGIIKKNGGLQPTASGANLKLKIGAGDIYDYGSNYFNSYTKPNSLSLPTFDSGVSDVFRYATSTGVIATDYTDVRVANYQVGGVETAIVGANTRVGLHFVWVFPATGNVRLTYGLDFYESTDDAVAAISSIDALSTAPSGFAQASLLGVIIARKNATDLTAATFLITNRFGGFGGGVVGSALAGSFLEIANNLSDLDSFTTARTNLDVYSTAEIDALVGGNGFIDLTPIAAPAYLEGRLFYDNVNKAVSYYNEEADVTINTGQENVIRVRNNTGVTITNNQAVYINGSQGANLPTVALAKADVLVTSRCIGLATHDIENNTNGYITTLGEVRDTDTSAFAAGDALYLSEITAGALTTTKPTSGFIQIVGYCVVSNASNGEIKVISGTNAQRANSWIDSEVFTASSGTEIQNEATSDISGQSGTAGFTALDWDIQGAGGSGTKRYVDFKDDGVRKFEVKLDGEFNSAYWNFNSVYMGGPFSGNGAIIAGAASLNNPTVVPRRGDSNTGLGGDGLGTVSLVGDGLTGFTVDNTGLSKAINNLEVGDFLGVNIAPSSAQIAYFAQEDSSPHVSNNAWANATFPSQTRGRNGNQDTLSTPNYHVFETYGTDATPSYSYIGSYSPSNGTSEMVLGTWDGTGAVEAIKIDSSQNTFFSGVPYVPSFTVAGVPSAATAAGIIYVSNETGGAVLAFSDGTNWRRVTDRSIIA